MGAPLFRRATHKVLQSTINPALENVGLNISTVFYTRHAETVMSEKLLAQSVNICKLRQIFRCHLIPQFGYFSLDILAHFPIVHADSALIVECGRAVCKKKIVIKPVDLLYTALVQVLFFHNLV